MTATDVTPVEAGGLEVQPVHHAHVDTVSRVRAYERRMRRRDEGLTTIEGLRQKLRSR